MPKDATSLNIAGSSTVYPITLAITDKYKQEYGNYQIRLSVSGTGGGFRKFCQQETLINNASRPINPDEAEACRNNGIRFISFEIAYDGIAVVVNPANDWVNSLTVDELKMIFGKNGVDKWSDVRPTWPNQPIKCYGPGSDSGTNDYFKETILKEGDFRSDFISSENDNLLVTGIGDSKYSLGFFGHFYYEANATKLKLVPIDNGRYAVLPTRANIEEGSYMPLSRPLYLYVNEDFLKDENGLHFIDFYLKNVGKAAASLGYVALPKKKYTQLLANITKHKVQ